jgi:Arc/MetJ-type ribon-helix-helix transcriptional regulator
MPNAAATIEIPEDLRAFAEERVRTGKAATVEEVVRDALEEKRLASLREAVDLGLAQAEAGQVVQGSPAELTRAVDLFSAGASLADAAHAALAAGHSRGKAVITIR